MTAPQKNSFCKPALKKSLLDAQQKLARHIEMLEKNCAVLGQKNRARDKAEALTHYAKISEQLNLHAEAIEAYQASLELNPADTVTLKNYGRLLANLDRYEQALAPLRKALHIDPVDLDTELFIMRLELSLGQNNLTVSTRTYPSSVYPSFVYPERVR